MKIKLIHDSLRHIAATGDDVEPGGTVEVPAEVGESLCEQTDVWEPVKAPTKKKGDD